MGEDIEIIQVAQSAKCAKDVIDMMTNLNADDIAVVLPIDIISEMVSLGVFPIRAKMERVNGSDGGFYLRHNGFERVVKVDIETTKI